MHLKTFLFLALAASAFAQVGSLSKVVDGDTVYFSNGDKCRLAFIDTPESKKNEKASRDASKCTGITVETIVEAGKSSSSNLSSMVRIGASYQYDVIDVDRYGRSVCIIKDGNGGTLNERMVSSGYAVPFGKYIQDQNDKRRFFGALRSAKQTNAGLWSKKRPVMQCMESVDQ